MTAFGVHIPNVLRLTAPHKLDYMGPDTCTMSLMGLVEDTPENT